MNKSSQARKSEILGMPFGTACGRLRRIVLFHVLEHHGENTCFRCGQQILKPDELTIEHKEAWQAVGASLFCDVDNIAFSHARCNLRSGLVRREVVKGTLWCSACKQVLPVARFHKDRRERTGFALICKDCSNFRRRIIKARGDCTACGAKRGTRPFRATHNICLSCHKKQSVNHSEARREKRRAEPEKDKAFE